MVKGEERAGQVKKRKRGAKVKARRTDAGRRTRVTAEEYNLMWEAYLETQNVSECARAAGVNFKTAQKYVTGDADPKRGMDPIRNRYERVSAAARKEEEETLVTFRSEVFREYVKSSLNMLRGEAVLHQRKIAAMVERSNAGARVDPSMPMDKMIKALDVLYRMGEHALGGPDQTVQLRDDRFRNWTEQELLEFWETGKRPHHDI